MTVLRQLMGLSTWVRVLVIFAFLWGILVLIFASKLNTPNGSSSALSDPDYTNRRLNQAIEYLEQSRKRNAELKQLIDEYLRSLIAISITNYALLKYICNFPKIIIPICLYFFEFLIRRSDTSLGTEDKQKLIDDIEFKLQHPPHASVMRGSSTNVNTVIVNNGMTPTNEYEQLRRRIRSNVQEMWNYVNSEFVAILKKAKPFVPELGEHIGKVTSMTAEHKRSLVNDMDRLVKIDGYEQWREQEAQSLSDLVQRRLHYLQNPNDCSKARKLVCRLNKVRISSVNFYYFFF